MGICGKRCDGKSITGLKKTMRGRTTQKRTDLQQKRERKRKGTLRLFAIGGRRNLRELTTSSSNSESKKSEKGFGEVIWKIRNNLLLPGGCELAGGKVEKVRRPTAKL